jgi:type II secretory pathway pseudopilin PulG
MRKQKDDKQSGFSLLEAVISMAVVTIGLIGILASFAAALGSTSAVQASTIARQKATETLESIYTERQTAELSFDRIQNISAGGPGIFVAGMVPLTDPGPDGLDGTLDDVAAAPITVPGYTGSQTGSAPSSQAISLASFKRQITITDVNTNLRQVAITVQYLGPQGAPVSYTIQALISAYR